MTAPRRQVEIESRRNDIVSGALIAGGTHQILESHRVVGHVCKRQPDVTLTVIASIVYCHQQPLPARTLPRKSQETIPGPIAVPCWRAFEQVPMPLAQDW